MRFRTLAALALVTLTYSISPAVPRQELGAEATVRAFLAHIAKGDLTAAAAMVEGSSPSATSGASPFAGAGISYTVKAARVYGDDKESVVVIDVDGSIQGNSKSMTDTFRLRKVDGIWKIQANPLMDSVPSPTMVASIMMSSPIFEQAKGAAKRTACLSNVKQLAIGTIMYAADHDDVLPDANKWRSSIMPYVKNEATFICPDDKSGNSSSYRMNAKISRVSEVAIADPAGTVLIYEGDQTGFVPRHEGRGNVGFADGHAKAVGAAEYPKLRKTK